MKFDHAEIYLRIDCHRQHSGRCSMLQQIERVREQEKSKKRSVLHRTSMILPLMLLMNFNVFYLATKCAFHLNVCVFVWFFFIKKLADCQHFFSCRIFFTVPNENIKLHTIKILSRNQFLDKNFYKIYLLVRISSSLLFPFIPHVLLFHLHSHWVKVFDEFRLHSFHYFWELLPGHNQPRIHRSHSSHSSTFLESLRLIHIFIAHSRKKEILWFFFLCCLHSCSFYPFPCLLYCITLWCFFFSLLCTVQPPQNDTRHFFGTPNKFRILFSLALALSQLIVTSFILVCPF